MYQRRSWDVQLPHQKMFDVQGYSTNEVHRTICEHIRASHEALRAIDIWAPHVNGSRTMLLVLRVHTLPRVMVLTRPCTLHRQYQILALVTHFFFGVRPGLTEVWPRARIVTTLHSRLHDPLDLFIRLHQGFCWCVGACCKRHGYMRLIHFAEF